MQQCASDWDYQSYGTAAALIGGASLAAVFLLLRLCAACGGDGDVEDATAFKTTKDLLRGIMSSAVMPFKHHVDNEPHLFLITIFLRYSLIATALALLGALPLIKVGIPCLGLQHTSDDLSGKLGTLSDLSLLRVLHALDRATKRPPDWDDSDVSARHARGRLAGVLCMIISLNTLIGLYFVMKGYARLMAIRKGHEWEDGCQAVVVSVKDTKEWTNLSEEMIKASFMNEQSRVGSREERSIEVDVVLAMPDFDDWANVAVRFNFMKHSRNESAWSETSTYRPNITSEENMYRSANDTSKSNEANADKSADHPYPHSKPVLSSSEKGTTNTQVTVGHPTSITATPTDSRGASTVILPTVLQMPDRTACTGYSQRINGLKRFVEHLQHCASTQSNNMRVSGWLLLGQDVRAIRNSQRIDCEASEARWQVLAQGRKSAWWRVAWCAALGAPLAGLLSPLVAISVASAPGFADQFTSVKDLVENDGLITGLVEGIAPAVAMLGIMVLAVAGTLNIARSGKFICVAREELSALRGLFYVLVVVCLLWNRTIAALLFSTSAFVLDKPSARQSIGDGTIFPTWWIFVFLCFSAAVIPAYIAFQPGPCLIKMYRKHLRRSNDEQHAASCTSSPNALLAGPLIAILYLSSLSLIFPLITLPSLALLYLSHFATSHRVSTSPSKGGHKPELNKRERHRKSVKWALWVLRGWGWSLAIQPTIFGVIMFSRSEWAIMGVCVVVATSGWLAVDVVTVCRYRRATEL